MKYKENENGNLEFLMTSGGVTYRIVPKIMERIR